MTKGASPSPSDARLLLAGIGRDGASCVHNLDDLPDCVAKLYLTCSPTRAIADAAELLPTRRDTPWRQTFDAALARAQLLVTVAAVTGREETVAPELCTLARKRGVHVAALLYEPLLSNSPRKSEAAAQLTKNVVRAADATLLFSPGPHAGSALTLSEAMDNWTQRLAAALRGLLAAAATDDAMDMDFTDIAAVLSGHCMASVGAGRGKTVEDALRHAAKHALAPPAELATAHSVFAHLVGDADMPLDDARRVLPALRHLFPNAEVGCGVSVNPDQRDIRATIIAGKLEVANLRSKERRRTAHTESSFFKAGDPAVYDGENLEIPAFLRKDIVLPGSPPRPVPAQKTLFDGRAPAAP